MQKQLVKTLASALCAAAAAAIALCAHVPYAAGEAFRIECVPSSDYGENGFRIVKHGGTATIYGGPRGIAYGRHECERLCGVEWFAADCVATSSVHDAAVDDFDLAERPAFEIRELWSREVCANPEFAARFRLNGTSNNPPPEAGGIEGLFDTEFRICHTFFRIADPRRDFKDHPEWFAEVDGKRIGGGLFDVQLCLSNPEVREMAVRKVLARMRANPQAQIFGISQQDGNDNYCRCRECSAIDAEEGSPSGSIIRFVNHVAEAVEREFPDRLVETLAYRYSKAPPKTAPRGNVIVCLCADNLDRSQTLADGTHPNNVAFRENLDGWSQLTGNIYIWDYLCNHSWSMAPFPNFMTLQPNMRYFASHGVRHMFAQMTKNYGYFRELRDYLVAKLMWDTDANINALTDQFMEAYYGNAAPFVREAFDLMNALPHSKMLGIYDHAGAAWMTDEFLDASVSLYRKAEAVVTDDLERLKRVRLLHASIAMCRFVRNRENFITVWCTRDPERFRSRAERFKDDVELFASIRAECGMDAVGLIHMSPFKEAYERRFQLMRQSVTVPERCGDTVRFEECCLNMIQELGGSQWRWRRVKDAEASEGEALLVRTDVREPVARLSFREVAFDNGERHYLRVRLRAEGAEGATGEVARIGIQGRDGKWKHPPRIFTGSDVANGYCWRDILEWTPSVDDILIVAPGAFDGAPAAKSLFIDQFEFGKSTQGEKQ